MKQAIGRTKIVMAGMAAVFFMSAALAGAEEPVSAGSQTAGSQAAVAVNNAQNNAQGTAAPSNPMMPMPPTQNFLAENTTLQPSGPQGPRAIEVKSLEARVKRIDGAGPQTVYRLIVKGKTAKPRDNWPAAVTITVSARLKEPGNKDWTKLQDITDTAEVSKQSFAADISLNNLLPQTAQKGTLVEFMVRAGSIVVKITGIFDGKVWTFKS